MYRIESCAKSHLYQNRSACTCESSFTSSLRSKTRRRASSFTFSRFWWDPFLFLFWLNQLIIHINAESTCSAHTFCPSPTAPSTKAETGTCSKVRNICAFFTWRFHRWTDLEYVCAALSRARTIAHARCGTLTPGRSCLRWKATRTLCTLWVPYFRNQKWKKIKSEIT